MEMELVSEGARLPPPAASAVAGDGEEEEDARERRPVEEEEEGPGFRGGMVRFFSRALFARSSKARCSCR